MRPITELIDYRKANTLSLAEVADKLDVTAAAVSRWERGKRYPDRKNLIKIAELVGAPASQIAGFGEQA